MKLPWVRRVEPHKHNLSGGWLGDVWDFDEPDGEGAQAVVHTARWRCSCGEAWIQARPSNEYPHMTSGVKLR